MIKLDKKTLIEFQEAGVKKIHVFFYEAWCSGTKVDIESEFEETTEVFQCTNFDEYGIEAYIKKSDTDKFNGAMITKIREKSDNPHLQGVKDKYIFSNPKVEDRCGCGTSFAFEKKVPKIDLNKLKLLRERFGK